MRADPQPKKKATVSLVKSRLRERTLKSQGREKNNRERGKSERIFSEMLCCNRVRKREKWRDIDPSLCVFHSFSVATAEER